MKERIFLNDPGSQKSRLLFQEIQRIVSVLCKNGLSLVTIINETVFLDRCKHFYQNFLVIPSEDNQDKSPDYKKRSIKGAPFLSGSKNQDGWSRATMGVLGSNHPDEDYSWQLRRQEF